MTRTRSLRLHLNIRCMTSILVRFVNQHMDITFLVFIIQKVFIIGFVIAGDPRQDIEHEHYISQRTPLIMPEPIRKFLLYFQRCIGEMKVMEIQDAYENG